MEVVTIAQLLKLKDYVTRYEWNPYRYTSQFIRMKKENWNQLYNLWEEDNFYEEENLELTEERSPLVEKFLNFLPRPKETMEDSLPDMGYPKTELELRHYFLERLFQLQLKWATSTLTDISFVDPVYETDELLKYFLMRFPDHYLLFFHPVFQIKNATIEGEIILLSPIEIEIIYVLENDPDCTVIAGDHRTWEVEKKEERESILSPMVALNRTEHLLKTIFASRNVNFPVSKIVLSRTNSILHTSAPLRTKFIGKEQYEDWFARKRNLNSPLKNIQLKIAELLLKYTVSNFVKRPEWVMDDTDEFTM